VDVGGGVGVHFLRSGYRTHSEVVVRTARRGISSSNRSYGKVFRF
jgi:hypothetical protein